MIAFRELIKKIPTTKNSSLQSRPFPSLSNILKAISKPLCDSENKREKKCDFNNHEILVVHKNQWKWKSNVQLKVQLLLVCPLGAFQD